MSRLQFLVPLDPARVKAFGLVRQWGWTSGLARWLLFLFFLLAVGLCFIPWQQTAYGEGRVLAASPTERQQSIDAPVDGWLESWLVQEGSHVVAGQPIVRIVDNDPHILDRLEAERAATEARVAAAEQALDTVRRNVRRQYDLFRQGLSARKQYEEAQLKEADAVKELTAAKSARIQFATKSARQGRQVVTAPREGIILRRTAGESGIYVKTGTPLAQLVPNTTSRVVELSLDGNDLPLLHLDQEVRLQFEGWPAIQFSGWPSVAVGTFKGRIALIDASDAGVPGRFRILVGPMAGERWPDIRYLRQGVRAHGWVLLNVVPLGFEAWRRFNAFPPSLPEEPAKKAAAKE